MGVLNLASLAAVLVLGGGAPALAHVSVTHKTAEAGGYQVLRFGLGHGCKGKVTTALRLEIPEGVASWDDSAPAAEPRPQRPAPVVT